MRGARAVAVLEDDRDVRPSALTVAFRCGDLVVLREREAQRLLAQHPGPGAQCGTRLLGVQRRRCADQHEVRLLGLQHLLDAGVSAYAAAGLCEEGREPSLVHIDGSHEAYAVGVRPECRQMAAGDDAARTHDGDAYGRPLNGHTAEGSSTDVSACRQRTLCRVVMTGQALCTPGPASPRPVLAPTETGIDCGHDRHTRGENMGPHKGHLPHGCAVTASRTASPGSHPRQPPAGSGKRCGGGTVDSGKQRKTEDRMTVTLADVATRAGVSAATVSRVLSGNYPVAGATRTRVLRAVEELQYVVNGPASALAASTSDLVGVLVNDIADPFFGIIASAVQGEMGESAAIGTGGRKLAVVCNTGGSPESELTYLTHLQRQRAAAVVLTGSAVDDEKHSAALATRLRRLASGGTRIVLCGRPPLAPEQDAPHDGVHAQGTRRGETGSRSRRRHRDRRLRQPRRQPPSHRASAGPRPPAHRLRRRSRRAHHHPGPPGGPPDRTGRTRVRTARRRRGVHRATAAPTTGPPVTTAPSNCSAAYRA